MVKLEVVRQKILALNELDKLLAFWHFKGKKLVFTNGCFDILHRGHIEYLAKAASFGDVLIVGLNSDASVRKLKGDSRPVQNQDTRLLILASLQFVSYVILFEEDTPYKLIGRIQPDILVKGADYKPEEIVGYDIVKKKGGQILTIDLVKGESTSTILNNIHPPV
jgi:rfaE bifunctional protein nucleotidyltransferase chain/domain